jgi:hypothetical protein
VWALYLYCLITQAKCTCLPDWQVNLHEAAPPPEAPRVQGCGLKSSSGFPKRHETTESWHDGPTVKEEQEFNNDVKDEDNLYLLSFQGAAGR